MNTPTKLSHSPVFQSPMSDQIRKFSGNELEICGAMKLFASPQVSNSPMLQNQLQQILDAADTGIVSNIDEIQGKEPQNQIKIVTPTLKKGKTPLFQAIGSPQLAEMPRSPSLSQNKNEPQEMEEILKLQMADFAPKEEIQVEEEVGAQLTVSQISVLERVFQLQEIDVFKLKSRQLLVNQIVDKIQLRNTGCKNRGYCKCAAKTAPPGHCSSCQKRLGLETKLIKFIQNYQQPISLLSLVELEAVKRVDPELFELIIDGEKQIQQEFGVESLENLERISLFIYGTRAKYLQAAREQSELYLKNNNVENYELVLSRPVNILLQLVTMLLYRMPPLMGMSLFQYVEALYSGGQLEKLNEKLQVKEQLEVDYQICFNKTNIVQFYIQFLREQAADVRLFRGLQLISGFQISIKSQFLSIKGIEAFTHDLCRAHPGLDFLRPTLEFVDFFARTVSYTAFYWAGAAQKEQIGFGSFKKLQFTKEAWKAVFEPDLNKLLKIFSYEHFYVVYCQFWQLDGDHDLKLSNDDMKKYGSFTCPYTFRCMCDSQQCTCKNVYNPIIIDRLFSLWNKEQFVFRDFVNFIIAEEDKDSTISTELFFELLDVDGDGAITRSDYEQFWPFVQKAFNCYYRPIPIEKFDNLMCQLADAAHHTTGLCGHGFVLPEYITLLDIRRSRLCANFFNVVVNVTKAIQFDVKDPYGIKFPVNALERNGFDRYCRLMYDLMDEADGQVEQDENEPLDAQVLD